jgi:hypothetical protein
MLGGWLSKLLVESFMVITTFVAAKCAMRAEERAAGHAQENDLPGSCSNACYIMNSIL